MSTKVDFSKLDQFFTYPTEQPFFAIRDLKAKRLLKPFGVDSSAELLRSLVILIKGNAVFLEFPNDYQVEFLAMYSWTAAQNKEVTPFENRGKVEFAFTFADLIKHMPAHFEGVKIPADELEVITPVEPTVQIKTEEVKEDGQEAKK